MFVCLFFFFISFYTNQVLNMEGKSKGKTKYPKPNSSLPPGQLSPIKFRARTYTYTCKFCDAVFATKKALLQHRVKNHKRQIGGGQLQPPPFDPNSDHFEQYEDSEAIEDMYEMSTIYILEPHNFKDDTFKMFNFPVDGHVTDEHINDQMEYIYKSEQVNSSYKLEIAPGFIMKSTEDGSIRYFKPSGNAYILDAPIGIVDRNSLEAGKRYLISLGLDESIRNFRQSSKYQVIYITQLMYHIWLVNFALGSHTTCHSLPKFIKTNR